MYPKCCELGYLSPCVLAIGIPAWLEASFGNLLVSAGHRCPGPWETAS